MSCWEYILKHHKTQIHSIEELPNCPKCNGPDWMITETSTGPDGKIIFTCADCGKKIYWKQMEAKRKDVQTNKKLFSEGVI